MVSGKFSPPPRPAYMPQKKRLSLKELSEWRLLVREGTELTYLIDGRIKELQQMPKQINFKIPGVYRTRNGEKITLVDKNSVSLIGVIHRSTGMELIRFDERGCGSPIPETITGFDIMDEWKEPPEVWINCYHDYLGALFKTREEAERHGRSEGDYLATRLIRFDGQKIIDITDKEKA